VQLEFFAGFAFSCKAGLEKARDDKSKTLSHSHFTHGKALSTRISFHSFSFQHEDFFPNQAFPLQLRD